MTRPLSTLQGTPSELVRAMERVAERISDLEDVMYGRSKERALLDIAGLESQSIDDVNDLVGAIRGAQAGLEAALDAIAEAMEPRGIVVLPDDPEGNQMHAGYIAHADGRKILPRETRRTICRD